MADSRPPLDRETGSLLPPGAGGVDGTIGDDLFDDVLDPDGLGKLASARELKFMLRTDGQVRSLESSLTLPLRQAGWSVEPADGDSGQAGFVRDVLTKPANAGGMTVPFGTVLAQMTSAILYRTASFEKVWTASDSSIVYDKLAYRPPTITRVLRDDRTGAYRGLEQDPPPGRINPIRIPPQRAFTYVHGQYREPVFGMSDFEVAATVFRSKQKIRWLWYHFLGNQTIPKTITSPADSTTGVTASLDQAKDAAKTIAKLRSAGTGAIPAGVDVQPLDQAGSAHSAFTEAIQFLDGEISGSVLASFTDLAGSAASGTGSYALSRDQSDFFLMALEAKQAEMAETITSYVIGDLVRWNYGRGAPTPRLVFEPLQRSDVEQAIGLLTGLAGKPGTPQGFIDQLIMLLARHLNLDEGKVEQALAAGTRQAVEQAATEQAAATAQVAAPVDIATAAIRREGGSPKALDLAGWDPSEHPRDDDGRFIPVANLPGMQTEEPPPGITLQDTLGPQMLAKMRTELPQARSRPPLAPGDTEADLARTWDGHASDHEVDALAEYLDDAYEWMNRYLRTGKEPTTATASSNWRQTLETVRHLTERSTIGEPVMAYRGIVGVNDYLPADDVTGYIIQDGGFLSTSISRGLAQRFAGTPDTDPGVLEVFIGSGTSAVPVQAVTRASEYEILLPPGTRILVVSDTREGDIRWIRGVVLPGG